MSILLKLIFVTHLSTNKNIYQVERSRGCAVSLATMLRYFIKTTLKSQSDILRKAKMSNTNAASKMSEQKVVKTIVSSPHVYKPVGPYSQAILADKTLYVSGVLGLDLQSQMVAGGAEGQTRQALDNLKHILEAGGSSLDGVVKTTILLANMDDFQAVNQVYAKYFPSNYPARATYQVAKLPLGAAVEIEAVALSGDLVVREAGPCPCAQEN